MLPVGTKQETQAHGSDVAAGQVIGQFSPDNIELFQCFFELLEPLSSALGSAGPELRWEKNPGPERAYPRNDRCAHGSPKDNRF
jgi:hypothetical protein